MYTLYVIPGSHACRSAMLMLEHKQVPYRRVDIVTLLHPLVVRLHGFDAGGQTRTAGGRRTFGLRLGDRLGTVPALAADGHRISTNYGIARFLDERLAAGLEQRERHRGKARITPKSGIRYWGHGGSHTRASPEPGMMNWPAR